MSRIEVFVYGSGFVPGIANECDFEEDRFQSRRQRPHHHGPRTNSLLSAILNILVEWTSLSNPFSIGYHRPFDV